MDNPTAWAMRFKPELVHAIEDGLKTQTRRPIAPGNIDGNDNLEAADLSTAYAAQGALTVRINMPSGDRRTRSIAPKIKPCDYLYIQRPGYGRKVPPALYLMDVQPCRLHDMTEQEALAEGVLVFADPAALGELRAALASAYENLLQRLGPINRKKWTRGELHTEAMMRGPSARDCFAVLWTWICGGKAWEANPWVWAYKFRPLMQSADEALRAVAGTGPAASVR